MQKQNEDLSAQQANWEDLRRATEQIQSLASMVGRVDDEEVQELRRSRDKLRSVESEVAALQRRLKDQETKAANNERTAAAARQSLTQAQQRAAEWETRANEYEKELEATRARLDDVEQTQSQLDADYSVLKLQVEERDAHERLARVSSSGDRPLYVLTLRVQDRESKLRDQIASLEGQLARARAEADPTKTSAPKSTKPPNGVPAHALQPRTRQNGYTHVSHTPSRPDSRASTVYGDSRVVTPAAHPNGSHYTPSIRAASPPQPSVWDSIHAPSARRDDAIRLPMTPKGIRPHQYYRPQIPSPTPSNVSAAPTLGEDGWWQ